MKGKVMHVILFLPQRTQQKKNMEKYHAKMAKAGNGEGLAPAVIDCWYCLSRVTCWDSAEGWPGNAFGVMQVWSTFLKTQISSFL